MSTYGVMQDRIADELDRSDLTSQIQLAIKSAISHYESDHFFFNETRATSTTTAGTEYYDVPTNSIELEEIAISNGTYKYILTPRTFNYLEEVSESTTYQGQPEDYAIYGESYRLHPVPDATYTISIAYIKKLTTLSATADTNAWMTSGEELIRARAKADLKINILEEPTAKQEAISLSNEGYYCSMEKSAHKNLIRRTTKAISTGRIRGTQF